MSDLDRETSVEERLERALGHRAGTTTMSPDGWERIEQRASARRRRRVATGWVAAPALAAAVAIALVAVTATGRDADPQVSAGPGGGHAFYAPLPGDDYHLTHATTSRSEGPSGRVRVYGRRAADGVTLDAAVLVVTGIVDGDADLLPSPEEAASARSARVRDHDATLYRSADGYKVVWTDPGGLTLAVLGAGVGEDDVLAVANAVEFDGEEARATTLPPGHSETYQGRWPPLPENHAELVTEQSWTHADDPQRDFSLSVSEDAGLSLDARTWQVTDLRTTEVGGRTALYSPREHSLSWLPRPGILLVLTGPSLSEAEVHSLAGGVRPLDEAGWGRLLDGLARSVRPNGHRSVITEGLAGGQRWKVVSYEGPGSRIGLCVEVSAVSSLYGDCGEVTTDITGIGRPQLFSSPDPVVGRFLVAAVAKSVAGGRLELADGTTSAIAVSGTSAGLAVNVLVARLPGDSLPEAVVALDAGGEEVGRQAVPDPPPAPGPLPPGVGRRPPPGSRPTPGTVVPPPPTTAA